jgi:hypothetical protein
MTLHLLTAALAAADPTPAFTTAANSGMDVLTKDGPWWLAIAVLNIVLRTFLDRQHRLQQGRLLSGLTAAAGIVTAVAAWHFDGGPSSGIVTALLAGYTLLLHPAPGAAPPAAGTAAKMTIASLVLLAACTATQARQAAGAGFIAAYDCEAAHFDPAVLDDLKSAARAKVDAWISGKAGADLPTLVAAVKTDLGAFKSDAGRCAVAAVLAAAAALVSPPTTESGLIALPAGPPPVMVRAAFELAAREDGWPPIKVSGAVL